MKQIYILFCFILASYPLFSQAEFMPIGFRFSSYASAMNYSSTLLITSEKDSTIDGVSVRKLTRKYSEISGISKPINYNIFVHQKSDSIFQYDFNKKGLTFLFKNKYNVGDTIFFKCNASLNKPQLVVDSIAVIDGMKRYRIRAKIPRSSTSFIVDTTTYLYDAFGPSYDWEFSHLCFYGFYEGERILPTCYRKNSTSNAQKIISQFANNSDCNLILSAEEISLKNLSISPNPANSILKIAWENEGSNKPISDISLLTIEGKIIQRHKVLENNMLQIDISNMQNGLYFLQLKDTENKTLTKKISIVH